jgi:hypothetical protein
LHYICHYGICIREKPIKLDKKIALNEITLKFFLLAFSLICCQKSVLVGTEDLFWNILGWKSSGFCQCTTSEEFPAPPART